MLPAESAGLIHQFSFSPSRIFLFLLSAFYALAVGTALILPWPPGLKLALVIVLLATLYFHLYRDVLLRAPAACIGLRIEEERVVLMRRDGAESPATVCGSTLVTPLLTVVNVQTSRRKQALLVFPDSMERERFRQLRVLLKWRKTLTRQAE